MSVVDGLSIILKAVDFSLGMHQGIYAFMDHARYERHENLLARLMEMMADRFTASEVQEVRHFLDHGEYGLALETFVDIAVEEDRKISADVYSLAVELFELMDMKASNRLEQLQNQVQPEKS